MLVRCCRSLLLYRPRVLHRGAASYYVRPKSKKGPSGQAWLALAGITTTLTGVGIYLLGKPEEEIEGLETLEPDKYANENVIKAYLLRARDTVKDFRKSFADPARDKLLPDLLPPQYQRPYTLVLELNDVLIHTEYERGVGWKYQKRPGVDALLMRLFDFYEIVLFTSENAMSGSSIVNAMDPQGLIIYKLYRDSTQYIKGQHVKDLSKLNRPITKVIMVDTNPKAVQYQQENSIILDKWTGDITDRTLLDLIPFLQTIALNEVDDVRPVLDFYKQQGDKNILETFRIRQAQLREEEERLMAERQQMARRGTGGTISTFSFGRLGGWLSGSGSDSKVSTSPSSSDQFPPSSVSLPLASDTSTTAADQSWTEWIGSWIGWK